MPSNSCRHPTCSGDTCRRPLQKRVRKPIKQYSAKPKKKEGSDEMKAFFKEMMLVNEPICANCGAFLPHLKYPYYDFLWKSCQAHLFEKRNFPSIATNPLNIVVLGSGISGMCHCHDTYDAAPSNMIKMPIYYEVVERFKKLYPLMLPEEHQFIPNFLLTYVVEIIQKTNP